MLVKDIMRTDYLEIGSDAFVSEALGKMNVGSHSAAVVVDSQKKYFGMFCKRKLLRSRVDACEMKVEHLVKSVKAHHLPVLNESMDIKEAARLLEASGENVLAVLDKNRKVMGIVGARDVIAALSDCYGNSRAFEICTQSPLTVSEQDKISVAASIMRKEKIDHLPVVDSHGNASGIVSTIDIDRRFAVFPQHRDTGAGKKGAGHTATGSRTIDRGDKHSTQELPVMDIMTKDIETARPDEKVSELVVRMCQKKISDVVIVKEKQPVGILTTRNLLRALVNIRTH